MTNGAGIKYEINIEGLRMHSVTGTRSSTYYSAERGASPKFLLTLTPTARYQNERGPGARLHWRATVTRCDAPGTRFVDVATDTFVSNAADAGRRAMDLFDRVIKD